MAKWLESISSYNVCLHGEIKKNKKNINLDTHLLNIYRLDQRTNVKGSRFVCISKELRRNVQNVF